MSLHQSTAGPRATAGSQTAAANEVVATSSSETSLQASAAGTELDASSVAAANQARAWPLSTALAGHRWRALLGRRTKDLPSESAPSAFAEQAEAATADGANGGISTAGSEATAQEGAAAAAASAAVAQEADSRTVTASAPPHLSADMGIQLQVGSANKPPGAALTTEEILAQADGTSGATHPSIPTAAAEQPATTGEQAAVKRKFSFRNSLKEAVAVPAVLRQVCKCTFLDAYAGAAPKIPTYRVHCHAVHACRMWLAGRDGHWSARH